MMTTPVRVFMAAPLLFMLFLAEGGVTHALAQPTPAAASSQQLLKPEELDQLVSPIALYPDSLLSEVLIGSTYPLEVVQADRWANQNKNLKGDQLTAAVAKQSWDDSIKKLAQAPTVLAMMNDKLDWTQKLGDAVLAQQPDVMDAIQRLRKRAQAAGKLQSNQQQSVSTKSEGQTQYVVIEPTSPTEIYVPYYNPAVVYGAWPYPAYPPYYWPPPPGYVAAGAIATGIAFGAGIAVGQAIWGNCDWGRHNINVVNKNVNINNFNRNNINNFSKWEHDADHRHGVQYNNDAVRQKFAKTDAQAGKAARQDFRGKDGEKVLDPDRDRRDGDRADRGDRERPDAGRDRGDRDGEAARGGERRDADRDRGQRPGGGQSGRDGAFANLDHGGAARSHGDRGRESLQGGGGGRAAQGGGGRGGGGRGGRR